MSGPGRLLDRALRLSPDPPAAGGSLFRPARGALLYELLGWAAGQIVALMLLLLVLFGAPVVEALAWTGWGWLLELGLQWSGWLDRLLLRIVPDALHLLIPVFGALAFVGQLLLTLAAVWARHRYTWLVAGEGGLRLHTGWLSAREVTMGYAAVQHVRLRQGPLQRYLGIGDVEVSSAAGGEGEDEDKGRAARIRNIARPAQLHELVRGRAEAARGLPAPGPTAEALAAAELLQAARELRALLEPPGAAGPT